MEATKNRGRSKILTCFKPVVDDDHVPGYDSASLPSSTDETAAKRKKRLRRSFSATLKAVLFKTALLKKSRSENSKQDCDGLRSNFCYKSKKLVNCMKKTLSFKPCHHEPDELIFRTNSDRSSLFSSNSSSRTPSLSSSASSRSSHSRSGSDKFKQSASFDLRQMSQANKQKTMKRDCGRRNAYKLTLEMCVFLVCLVALIWGKVFATVVCTSMWLFFPPGHRRSHQLRRAESFDVVDLEEYNKKRVIMEGLLERNR